MSGNQVLPVDVYKILDNTAYYHASKLEAADILSPIEWIQIKNDLKERLPYVHYNEICEKKRIAVPEHVLMSMTLINMSIDMNLCYKNICEKNINKSLMMLIVDKIIATYKRSLVEYGTSIGMIASQCTSESMTQRILDSIHASGASKSNFLTTIKEVYGGKKTEQLSNPYMDIFVKEEYSDDITIMQQIANEIEMMTLKTFVVRVQIFFEHYKKIEHPKYAHEIKTIFGPFEKHHINQKVPSNLLKWCVRLELSHSTLIEKTMSITSIYRKLVENHPLLYIVYTDDNSDKIIMRLYFTRDVFKKDIVTIDQHVVHEYVHNKLLKTMIRGVEGITSAMVMKEFVPRSIVQDDGSIKVIRKHIIRTTGTNLREILNHSYVDPTRTTTNSIPEIKEMYGIHAARMKFIQCARELSGADINVKHYTIIADTLTHYGFMSNIEKSGLDESNVDNVLLTSSFARPIQTLTDAALHNDSSTVHSNISSALMMGTTPDIGSNYNGIVMNSRFIDENACDIGDILDDL